MSYWDLSQSDREHLRKMLITREAMSRRGIDLPRELYREALMQEYSLTDADWKSIEGKKL